MEKNGVKFACLCARLFPHRNLQPAALEGRFHVEQPWIGVNIDTWKEALGTWTCNEIRDANFWVWTVEPSAALDVRNKENDRLRERILHFWTSLLLHEMPEIRTAWVLTGSLIQAKVDVHDLHRLIQTGDSVASHILRAPKACDADTLASIARIAAILEESERNGQIAGRLDRGIAAFVSGRRTGIFIDDAILDYVRAVEGILHPRDREKFCQRGNSLIEKRSGGTDFCDLLRSIYNARSCFSHAETLDTAFPGMGREEAVRCGEELRAAIFLIASRCYIAVLSDPGLIRLFSQEKTGDYWGKVVTDALPPPFQIKLAGTEYKYMVPLQRKAHA